MTLTSKESAFIILTIAGCTFLTRALPFLLFRNEEKTPAVVQYLGKVLPGAVIAMLLVYCVKQVSVTAWPFGIPELLAIGVTGALHWKVGNSLLSIGLGTAMYMCLVQIVFT